MQRIIQYNFIFSVILSIAAPLIIFIGNIVWREEINSTYGPFAGDYFFGSIVVSLLLICLWGSVFFHRETNGFNNGIRSMAKGIGYSVFILLILKGLIISANSHLLESRNDSRLGFNLFAIYIAMSHIMQGYRGEDFES